MLSKAMRRKSVIWFYPQWVAPTESQFAGKRVPRRCLFIRLCVCVCERGWTAPKQTEFSTVILSQLATGVLLWLATIYITIFIHRYALSLALWMNSRLVMDSLAVCVFTFLKFNSTFASTDRVTRQYPLAGPDDKLLALCGVIIILFLSAAQEEKNRIKSKARNSKVCAKINLLSFSMDAARIVWLVGPKTGWPRSCPTKIPGGQAPPGEFCSPNMVNISQLWLTLEFIS